MFYKGDFLLPKKDFEKWSVVACDQYTSEPQYWARVDELVADAPSALRLIYPEVYLGKEDGEIRTANIHKTMADYLQGDCLQEIKDSYVLVVYMGGILLLMVIMCERLNRICSHKA